MFCSPRLRSSSFGRGMGLHLPTLLAFLLLSCGDGRVGLGDNTPGGIIFDLEIPTQVPTAPLMGTSGSLIERQEILLGDSIIAINSAPSFFAQFAPRDTSVTMPTAVLLNGTALGRHHDGDTFRLAASSNSLFGDNVWDLGNSADTTRYVIEQISPMDSVQPFTSAPREKVYRGDSALTISWKRTTLPSNGVAISLRGTDTTVNAFAFDAGSYTVSAALMAKLRGRTRVTLTRYYSQGVTWNGISTVLARLAQYRVTITVQ